MPCPIISFIVPVYKVDYSQLKRCIDSLLSQHYDDGQLEIILIDDGSPDDCGAICDMYAAQHFEIKVIHQSNQGLSVVRNVGVKNATSDWVAFVDGDDWIEENTFECAASLIKRAPDDSDIIIWDGFAEYKKTSKPICFFDIDETDKLLTFRNGEKEKVIDRILPRYVNSTDINRCASLGVTWARIYRKKMLLDNNIWNIPGLKLMQDSVFNLWAVEYARTICYQYVPLYHYSMYEESISKKQDPTASDTVLQLYHYYSDFIMHFHNEETYWQRLYIRTIRMLVKCLSKDYANPNNKSSLKDRISKMKKDFDHNEFRVALQNCNMSGQDIKLRAISFLLRNKLYMLAIISSQIFSGFRNINK